MEKPLFNADDAEEYFSSLCASYRETANEIFNRDNEGRHASEQMYSAEYQKYIGMQIAMREVLEYFAKFEPVPPQKTNADRIRAKVATDGGLADRLLALDTQFAEDGKGFTHLYCHGDNGCVDENEDIICNAEMRKACILRWLQQPAEEVQ